MMEAQACVEMFEALKRILGQRGLGWLVDAVEREAQEGVIEEATKEDMASEVLLSESLRLEPEFRRSIKRADFLVRREITPEDRLLLLVNAIDEVVAQANDIESGMMQFFRESGGPSEFQFIGAESVHVPMGTSLDLIGQRSAAVRVLHILLRELRQEISQ